MRNIELLAPAGDFESLKAAVQNGANAIYLGGTLFNARAFAHNFSNEDLMEAVAYAHLRNVKIYVTVNTLFYDDEFEELMAYIDFLYTIQVDAILVQDLGLMHLIHERYPDFAIHASTQASIHSLAGVKALETQGVKRVVLARENTLEEIRSICENTNLEIEAFVHGALCMCYSGQCLMSSMIGKRSGNRGKCAQPCRLRYKLHSDKERLNTYPSYLLSAKDICTIDHIGEFIDAGVTSFKIEGRMKKPEYVSAVVKAYRKAIDAYLNDHQLPDLTKEKREMSTMFDRGSSLGHAFKENDLITNDFPGHRGYVIGEVASYDKKKKMAYIKLSDTLKQEDGIRFGLEDLGRTVNKLYIKNHLVNQAHQSEIVGVEFNLEVKEKTKVYKTLSIDLLHDMKKTYEKEQIHLPLNFKVYGKINQPMHLEIHYQDECVHVTSSTLIEKALNKPLEHERIQQQLSKLGSTIYRLNHLEMDLPEQMQFSIKELNAMRRDGIDLLNKKRLEKNHRSNLQPLVKSTNRYKNIQEIHVHTLTYEQCLQAIKEKVDVVYYPIERKNFVETYHLAQENGVRLIPYASRIQSDRRIAFIKKCPAYNLCDTLLVGDIGGIEAFKDHQLILDTSLNLTNSYSLQHPLIQNKTTILSLEMSQQQINAIQTQNKTGIVTYGRVEMMIANYCPISQSLLGKKTPGCNLCKKGNYTLIDRRNQALPIKMDSQCRMHLYNPKTLYINELQGVQADFIVLKMTFEDANQVKKVIDDFKMQLETKQNGNLTNQIDVTLGYFKM